MNFTRNEIVESAHTDHPDQPLRINTIPKLFIFFNFHSFPLRPFASHFYLARHRHFQFFSPFFSRHNIVSTEHINSSILCISCSRTNKLFFSHVCSCKKRDRTTANRKKERKRNGGDWFHRAEPLGRATPLSYIQRRTKRLPSRKKEKK